MVRRPNLAWDPCNCVFKYAWSCFGGAPGGCPPTRGSSVLLDTHSVTHFLIPLFMVWCVAFVRGARFSRRGRWVCAAVVLGLHVSEDLIANFGGGCCTWVTYWDNDSAQNFVGDQLSAAAGIAGGLASLVAVRRVGGSAAAVDYVFPALTGTYAAVVWLVVAQKQIFGGLVVWSAVSIGSSVICIPFLVGLALRNPYGWGWVERCRTPAKDWWERAGRERAAFREKLRVRAAAAKRDAAQERRLLLLAV